MNYLVSLDNEIDFAPATETAEILQNVKTIITTRRGTVPLHRDFGMPWDTIDAPLPVSKALLQASVIEAINEYEPRARVVSIEFEEDLTGAMEGVLKPRVIVSIGNDEGEV